MVECKLSLELTKNGIQKSVHAKAGESNSRKLLITLTEKGRVYELEGFHAKVLYGDDTYSKATVNGNVIEFVLPSELIAAEGERLCELQIYREGESYLYSPRFIVAVEESFDGGNASELAGEKIAYQQVIPQLNEGTETKNDDLLAVYDVVGGDTKAVPVGTVVKNALNEGVDHNDLKGRDEADQHPMESITGLLYTLNMLSESDQTWARNVWQDVSKNSKRIADVETAVEENKSVIGFNTEARHMHDNKNALDNFEMTSDHLRPTFKGNTLPLSGDIPSSLKAEQITSLVRGFKPDEITNFISNGYLSGNGLYTLLKELEDLYAKKTDISKGEETEPVEIAMDNLFGMVDGVKLTLMAFEGLPENKEIVSVELNIPALNTDNVVNWIDIRDMVEYDGVPYVINGRKTFIHPEQGFVCFGVVCFPLGHNDFVKYAESGTMSARVTYKI